MLLSLDPSSRVIGYGILDGNRLKAWANVKIKGIGARRFLAIEELLNQLTSQSQYPIDEIAMEVPKWRSTRKPAHSFFVAIDIIRDWAKHHKPKLPVFEYPPATVKLSAAGKGNATKDEVHRVLCMEYPELTGDTLRHATDAVGVAVCHREAMRLKALGMI